MPAYRLYLLDGAGKITKAEWVDAATDEEAVRAARDLNLRGRCEVWAGNRHIASIDPKLGR